MKDHYHHGNLKKELIEVGIKIISEKGFEHLSLRNISQQCGVSHNAIYHHFDNKEQMIDCCREYVTQTLTEYLEQSINELDNAAKVNAFCHAYLSFYLEYPTYYSFLYRNSAVKIVFSVDEVKENYPPFELFRKVCKNAFESESLTDLEFHCRLVHYWSLMHGMCSLMLSENVQIDCDWDETINKIFGEGFI